MTESVTLTAKLVTDSTPLSGKTVNFYYWDGSQYVLIDSQTTNVDGEASISYDATADTIFKAEFAGDATYDASEDTAPYSYGELQDLASQLALEKSSSVVLSSTFNIQKSAANDLSLSFTIGIGATSDLSSCLQLKHFASADLSGKFGSGSFSNSANLCSSLYVPSTYAATSSLRSSFYVPTLHAASVILPSRLEIPIGSIDLPSSFTLPKAVRWKIQYYDGTWQLKSDAVVEQIVQELDGHEEAIFYLPNTASNRSFVSTNQRIRILFGSQVLFTGRLYGTEYRNDILRCFVYIECYETMKARTHSGTYNNVSAQTILQNICNDAGVVAGECPDSPVSVRFHYATCFDAATFLAKTLNRDFWADYDDSGNPRFNIGVRATNKDTTKLSVQLKDESGNPLSDKTIHFYYSLDGSTWLFIGTATTNYLGVATLYHAAIQDVYYKAEFKGDDTYGASSDTESYSKSITRTFTPLQWPSRMIDRAKKRDKVIVIGVDENGNEVIGTAGTGTNVAVIRERKAIDQDTAQALASKYYEELSKESSGAQLPASITDAYDLFPGDTVTLENSLLGYSGVYRILKTTKRLDRVTIELDRASAILEQLIERTERFEDLGIYPISRLQMPATMPSGTSFPSNPRAGDLFYRTDEDRVYRYNGTSWVKIVVTTGEGTSFPANPRTGDLFYRTDENTLYRFDGSNWKAVHALSQHGDSLPSDGRVGDFFFNTTENALYRYNGSQWVEVLRITQSGTSLPASGRFVGDLFYSTNYEQTFYWTGTAWVPLATIARSGTSFPSDVVAGDVFFRTDELKFYRYNGTDWIVVHPEMVAAPPENLVLNQSFEIDRDGDNVPDNWTSWHEGTLVRDTSDSYKGAACARLSCNAGQSVALHSDLIPISPEKRYYVQTAMKKTAGDNPTLRIVWYDKDKQALTTYTDFYPALTSSWQVFGYEIESSDIPSNARYAAIHPFIWSASADSTFYVDDVLLSEQRAAAPTAKIVPAYEVYTPDWVSVPADEENWTDLFSWTFGSEETEITFLRGFTVSQGDPGVYHLRVRDETDGINYPCDEGVRPMVLLDIGGYYTSYPFLFTIPKPIPGHLLKLQIRQPNATQTKARLDVWSHTPHYHR